MSDKTSSKRSTSKVDDNRMIVVETQMSVKERRKNVKKFTKIIASSVKVEDETRLQFEERQERKPYGLWDETQGSRSWCEKVENWDIERNDERSRKKGGEDAFSRKTLSHSGSSEVNDMMQCMNRMLKSSALPEPKTFDGTGEFKQFKRAFLLKYNHVTENDYELVAILEGKFLKGAAKSLFKTLPKRFERSIQSLFEEFEQKLRKRQGDSKIEALNEFEGLEKRSDQKMWEYLVEVEKWSRRSRR